MSKPSKITHERLHSRDDFRAQVNLNDQDKPCYALCYGPMADRSKVNAAKVRNRVNGVILAALKELHEGVLASELAYRSYCLEWYIMHLAPDAYDECLLYCKGRLPITERLLRMAKPYLGNWEYNDVKEQVKASRIVIAIKQKNPTLL